MMKQEGAGYKLFLGQIDYLRFFQENVAVSRAGAIVQEEFPPLVFISAN